MHQNRNICIFLLISVTAMLVSACSRQPDRFPIIETSPIAEATQTALPTPSPTPAGFNGQRAYADVITQMDFGPRIPGSLAHDKIVAWLQNSLQDAQWSVEIQETTRMDHPIRNVIAKRGTGAPWIILGAHYDSRMHADQDADPAKHSQPVPGANDGASGVAVLLELARTLPSVPDRQIWLVFIDAEDQGDLPKWDWLLGSRAFADSLTSKPDAVIIIDMIGDSDLNIYKEENSDPVITQQIMDAANQLGYGNAFFSASRWNMIDDHTPFLEKGIHAVDLIDFDYPYWHTTQDTADKVSASSLQAVGDTLLHWTMSFQP